MPAATVKARRVRIELEQAGDRVQVEVRDWGIGFDPAQVELGHYGLQGIRQRAQVLGGTAVIEAAPGKGTRVSVDLPSACPRSKTATNGTQSGDAECTCPCYTSQSLIECHGSAAPFPPSRQQRQQDRRHQGQARAAAESRQWDRTPCRYAEDHAGRQCGDADGAVVPAVGQPPVFRPDEIGHQASFPPARSSRRRSRKRRTESRRATPQRPGRKPDKCRHSTPSRRGSSAAGRRDRPPGRQNMLPPLFTTCEHAPEDRQQPRRHAKLAGPRQQKTHRWNWPA